MKSVSGQRVSTAREKTRHGTVAIDPLVLQAVADVDRSLLHWSLALSPRERLRSCSRATATLIRLRDASADR